jgi:hypothetical protein
MYFGSDDKTTGKSEFAGRIFYYRISFYLRCVPNKIYRGVRTHPSPDIDFVHLLFFNHANDAYPGEVEGFECIQLASHLPEVKEFIRKGKLRSVRNPFDHPWQSMSYQEQKQLKESREKQLREENINQDRDQNQS